MVKYELNTNTKNPSQTSRILKTKKTGATTVEDKENLRRTNGDLTKTDQIASRQNEDSKSVIKLNGNAIGSMTTFTLNTNGESVVHTETHNGDDKHPPPATTATNNAQKSDDSTPQKTQNTNSVPTVSYTHLTLPTNREV